jgi:hypothetical protein
MKMEGKGAEERVSEGGGERSQTHRVMQARTETHTVTQTDEQRYQWLEDVRVFASPYMSVLASPMQSHRSVTLYALLRRVLMWSETAIAAATGEE